MKIKSKFSLKKEYQKSWKYLKESKKFILIVIGIFFAFTLIGDAELYEGSCWEALMFASEEKLNNLIVIIDRNRLMVTDNIGDTGPYLNIESKIKSFGFEYLEVDGHNIKELLKTFTHAKKGKKPSLVIANTIKGKGVSVFENNPKWHSMGIDQKTYEMAKKELLENG